MASISKPASTSSKSVEDTFFFAPTKKELCADMIAAFQKTKDCSEAQDFHIGELIDWCVFLNDNPHIAKLNITTTSMVFHTALSIGGLNLLIHELQSKPSMSKDFLCFACDTVEDFEKALSELKSSSFEGKIAFLVRAENFDNPDFERTHTQAVLVEKKKNSIKICIMDSIKMSFLCPKGDDQYEEQKDIICSPCHNLYVRINDAKFENVEIFIPDIQRQFDDTNCSIFAINDVKCFFKNDIFFEDLEKYGKLEKAKKDSELYIVNNLMPQHHRLTQSNIFLKRYILDSNSSLRESIEALEKSVKKSQKKMKETKKENMKAEARYYKFLHFIRHYAEKFPEELTSISSMYNVKNLSKHLQN